MKLTKIVDVPRKCGNDPWLRLVFENDGRVVEKMMPAEGIVIKVADQSKATQWRRYGFMKRAVEAERDFAFDMFGKDWLAHVGKIGCDLHMRLMDEAARMRPDLFAETATC